jgi:predicted KAP-like P-loop ATPase
LISFALQLQNIEEDNKEKEFTHKTILAVADEIEKLHQENEEILAQNREIIELLKRGI